MTSYTTTAAVKTYIGTSKATDDALLATLIPRACQRIDTYCQRRFDTRDEVRVFDAVTCIDGQTLTVDDDLQAVTTITNGDGTTLDANDFVLLPANLTPKFAIKLLSSSGKTWTYETDPEEAISVEASWGFVAHNTPPDDIIHAAVRLTAWLYHQREAPFETTAMPGLGAITVPSDMPPDIQALLDPYVRTGVGGV